MVAVKESEDINELLMQYFLLQKTNMLLEHTAKTLPTLPWLDILE